MRQSNRGRSADRPARTQLSSPHQANPHRQKPEADRAATNAAASTNNDEQPAGWTAPHSSEQAAIYDLKFNSIYQTKDKYKVNDKCV